MKYQQGGVSNVPNFPAPNVGGIPNSPEFQWPTMPGIDIPAMANMAQDRYTRQRQIEADQLKQQAALEGDQKDFAKLNDAIFGGFHNPAQMEILNGLKPKYGIPETWDGFNISDPRQVTQTTSNLYKYTTDPQFMQVAGEAEAADAYIKRGMGMTWNSKEARDAWDASIKGYAENTDTKKRYGPTELDPAGFNEKVAAQVKFSNVAKDIFSTSKNIDITDERQVNQALDLAAEKYALQDAKAAIDQNLITNEGTEDAPYYKLTPRGEKITREQLTRANDIWGQGIQDKKNMIQYKDKVADENRAQTQAHADAVRAAKENGKTAGGHKSTVGGVFMSDAVRENLKTKGYTDEMIDDPAVRAEFGNVLDEKGNYVGSTASHDVAAEAGKVAWNKQTKSHGDYINKAGDLGYDVTQYPVQKAIQDAVDQGASLDELDGLIKAAIKKKPIVPKTQSSTNLLPTDNTSNPPATQVAPVAPPAAGTFGEFKKQN